MDWLKHSGISLETVKKYRYLVALVLVGIFLMILPGRNSQPEPVPQPSSEENTDSLQSQLEALLSHLEGAGKVKVLLTESAGQQTLYQTDDTQDTSGDSKGTRRDTVLVTNASRAETGLVRQVIPPKYLGAVILCQGADSAAVRLAVIEAVSSATGLATHQISVLKMK